MHSCVSMLISDQHKCALCLYANYCVVLTQITSHTDYLHTLNSKKLVLVQMPRQHSVKTELFLHTRVRCRWMFTRGLYAASLTDVDWQVTPTCNSPAVTHAIAVILISPVISACLSEIIRHTFPTESVLWKGRKSVLNLRMRWQRGLG